ncbi:MAG: peroxiredoxin family protein [Candidatus Rokuibacteriota bacterium]
MCTKQLVKLQYRVKELTSEGAAVFAVSIDNPQQARQLVQKFALSYPILSDPGMKVIQQYGMKGERMKMADLGYVVIDLQGRIRVKRIDREFGDHADLLLRHVRQAKAQT